MLRGRDGSRGRKAKEEISREARNKHKRPGGVEWQRVDLVGER